MSLAPTFSGSQVLQGLTAKQFHSFHQGADPFRSELLLEVDPLTTLSFCASPMWCAESDAVGQ
jgi:hypothetical protein